VAYGAQPAGTTPFFVVTHSSPNDIRLERELGLRFTCVNGLTATVDQACTAATDGHDVIMGGGDVIGQAVEKGLVDELHLHLAPDPARRRDSALSVRYPPALPST